MRRICPLVTAALLAAIYTPPVSAQAGRTWSIGLTGSLVNFRGGAASAPADGLSVRPSQGGAFGLAALRESGAWTASLGVNSLPTYIEGVTDDLLAQVRIEAFDRVRIVAHIGRRLARVGEGRLDLRAGPALDHWSLDGGDGRTRAGVDAQLALRLPIGRFQLENHLGIGWSPSPFDAGDLLAGYRRETLRTVTVGTALWLGL